MNGMRNLLRELLRAAQKVFAERGRRGSKLVLRIVRGRARPCPVGPGELQAPGQLKRPLVPTPARSPGVRGRFALLLLNEVPL